MEVGFAWGYCSFWVVCVREGVFEKGIVERYLKS